jgi:rod shape-determining protein MreD
MCLLLAYGGALAGRSMMAGQSRLILWVWYALTTATAMVAGYLFVMLDSKSTPGLIPMAWQFLATIVLYPFAQRLIDLFEDADVRFR